MPKHSVVVMLMRCFLLFWSKYFGWSASLNSQRLAYDVNLFVFSSNFIYIIIMVSDLPLQVENLIFNFFLGILRNWSSRLLFLACYDADCRNARFVGGFVGFLCLFLFTLLNRLHTFGALLSLGLNLQFCLLLLS